MSLFYIIYEVNSGSRSFADSLCEIIELLLEYFEYAFTYEFYFSEIFFLSEYILNLFFSVLGVYHDKAYSWNPQDTYIIGVYVLFQIVVGTLSNFDLGARFAKYKEIKLVIIDSHFENFLNPVFKTIDIYLNIKNLCKSKSHVLKNFSENNLNQIMSGINKLALYIIIVMLYAFNFVVNSITSYTVSY